MNYILKNVIEHFGDEIFSVKPVSKEHKHLFDMSEFSDADIDKLIHINIEDKNLEELEEELANLCGGIVIMRDEKVLLTPTCCGDLSDIYNWEEIKLNSSNEWTKIWIGHPWVFCRRYNGQIELSDYYNDEDPEIKFENIQFAIPEEQLEDQLKQVRLVQERFQKRLADRLKMKNINNYKNVAERMGCSYR